MPRCYRSTPNPSGRPDIYRTVTDRIIAELQAGRVPWIQPWDAAHAAIGLPSFIVSNPAGLDAAMFSIRL